MSSPFNPGPGRPVPPNPGNIGPGNVPRNPGNIGPGNVPRNPGNIGPGNVPPRDPGDPGPGNPPPRRPDPSKLRKEDSAGRGAEIVWPRIAEDFLKRRRSG
jgi:hypothetical protein